MKQSSIILFFLSLTLGLPSAFGQNLYVEVVDANTYRGIPDVKVELESQTSKMTFYTSPAGSVGENVPSGTYVITLSRAGYHTLVETDVRVRTHELTTLSLRMQRLATAPDDRDRTDRERPGDRPVSETETTRPITRTQRKGFVGLGYQLGQISGLNVSFSLNLFRGVYMQIEYARCQQSYFSQFFEQQHQLYDIGFNSFLLGTGYHLEYALFDAVSIFARPGLSYGIEMFNNSDQINHEDVNLVLSHMIKPGLKTGATFRNFGLFMGLNYTAWISGATNQSGTGLYNGLTEEQLKWDEDLFSNRSGIGLTIGLNYFF